MADDYTVVKIDDIEAIFRGAFRRARAALGATAFGLQVIDMPPNLEGYPEHDHSHDGQEEVYAVLRGGGEIEIDGERFPLDPDHLARVGPTAKRKVHPGPEGMRLMVIGGTPGAIFEAKDFTELGAPDPFAA
jgi:mannose-6-phosphate isomerase-like protein (cupin superfamily)